MYCQRDPLFAGKVIKVPIHLGVFYYVSVMWSEKSTVAVETVCLQNSKGAVKDYSITAWRKNSHWFHWSLDFAREVYLSLNSNRAIVNGLPPSPHIFSGSLKSALLRMCSHCGRRNKVAQSADSSLFLKPDDSKPGLWLSTDICLSRCNSIGLMPEDS